MRSPWICILLIAALSGCQLIPGLNPSPSLSPQPSTPTATPAPVAKPVTPAPSATQLAVPTPFGPLVLVSKNINVSSAKPPYEIKLQYPEFADATTPNLQAFNTEAKKQAQDLVAGFQKDFDLVQPLPEPSAATGSFMEAKYTVTYGLNGLLSAHFIVGFYMSGAAHPNSFSVVINFDLIHGKKLELADLFLPGSDYLKAISDLCTAELKNRDRLASPEGALPTVDNYKNWNITPQGLQITFDSYQVTPYVMGPSQVNLPYPSLKTLLKPDGPLAGLLK